MGSHQSAFLISTQTTGQRNGTPAFTSLQYSQTLVWSKNRFFPQSTEGGQIVSTWCFKHKLIYTESFCVRKSTSSLLCSALLCFDIVNKNSQLLPKDRDASTDQNSVLWSDQLILSSYFLLNLNLHRSSASKSCVFYIVLPLITFCASK